MVPGGAGPGFLLLPSEVGWLESPVGVVSGVVKKQLKIAVAQCPA